ARRANNRHHFPRLDLQIEILEDGQPMAAHREALDDAAGVEKWHRCQKQPRRHEDTKKKKIWYGPVFFVPSCLRGCIFIRISALARDRDARPGVTDRSSPRSKSGSRRQSPARSRAATP